MQPSVAHTPLRAPVAQGAPQKHTQPVTLLQAHQKFSTLLKKFENGEGDRDSSGKLKEPSHQLFYNAKEDQERQRLAAIEALKKRRAMDKERNDKKIARQEEARRKRKERQQGTIAPWFPNRPDFEGVRNRSTSLNPIGSTHWGGLGAVLLPGAPTLVW